MVERPVDWRVSDRCRSFRWGYSGQDLVAEWGGLLSIRATRDGELKSIEAFPGARKDLVEKLRFGIAAAFLRAQRNECSLHASGVALGCGRALLCIGASGLGKSTLAEQMCRRYGVTLLADDVAGLTFAPDGRVLVIPSESGIWLMDPNSREKSLRRTTAATHPVELACVVSLAFDDSASSLRRRDLHGAEAVSALLPALIRFQPAPETWMRELSVIEHLTSKSQILEVRRSHDVAAEDVATALLTFAAPEEE